MGIKYVTDQGEGYDSIEEVAEAYPAAAHIEPVEDGWAIFDTITDFEMWQNQV
jgi:hypothetical protein